MRYLEVTDAFSDLRVGSFASFGQFDVLLFCDSQLWLGFPDPLAILVAAKPAGLASAFVHRTPDQIQSKFFG